jgi:hypothetical protein
MRRIAGPFPPRAAPRALIIGVIVGHAVIDLKFRRL